MANCKYSLTLSGKTIVYDSYEKLLSVLINNKNRIEFGDINDLAFSANPQAEVASKIKHIKDKNLNIKIDNSGVDVVTGTVNYKGSGKYIHLSEFMLNPDSGLNNPINLENYKTNEINKLTRNGMDQIQAKEEVDKNLARWELDAVRGQQLKSIIALYLSGVTNPKMLMNKIEASENYNIDFNVYSEITKNLKEFKDNIESRYGADVKYIPSVTVTSDIKNFNKKLLYKIDLIVIDNKGVPHIVVFKTSEKSAEEWQAVKDQDIDYRIGFARHMLAANGISVKNSDLLIAPVNIILDDDGKFSEVAIDKIQNRLTPSKTGLNRLSWGSGSFYSNIDKFIPITITDDLVSSNVRENVIKNMGISLGTNTMQNTRAISSMESFISRVRESDDYSKGKWMFLDTTGTKSKVIYIKETSPKESNTELREKVTKYLEKESNKYEKAGNTLIKDLTKAIQGKLDFGEILTECNRPSYLSQMFSKYTGDEWSVVDIPKLRDLGILGILNSKTKQIDFFSISYHFGMNTIFNKFGLGTTLLGKYESDRTALAKPNILKATNGNIELMKILFTINELPELFNGVFKVGSVRAINPLESSAAIASQSELWTTFDELCKHSNITNNLADSIEFADQFDILTQDYLSTFNDLKTISSFSKIKASLLKHPQDLENKLKIIDTLISTLERNYKHIISNIMDYKNSPITNLYVNAWMTKFYLEGDPFYQSSTLEKFNIVSGVKVTAPSLIGDKNLKTMNRWIQNTLGKITSQYNKFLDYFQYNYIRNGIWKDKGYSQSDENILGSQNKLYSNMLLQDPLTGRPNSNLIVKNPWTDNSLSEVEKKVLKRMLYEWNKWRYPMDLASIKSENDPKLKAILEQKDTSFWVPLIRASSAARISQKGISEIMKQTYKDIKDFGSYFRRDQENIDTENAEIKQVVNRIRNNRDELFKFFNPIEFSEHDLGKRAEYIASQDFDYWSRNLEDVTLGFELINLQKKEYNLLLPKIKALKIAALLYGEESGVAMDTFVEYLEDQTKISIHNQTILNEEAQKAAGVLSFAKYMASCAILGFNIRGLVREHIEGTWKLWIEGLASKYGKDAFNMEDVRFAEKYIYKDISKQPSEVTKAEKLNQLFRLANLDLNMLAQRTKTNKGGLMNFSDRWMFWCNTAPDFRKRLVLLIAQLKHDGIWEALSIEKDSLKYEWRKDKRFNILASGNKTNPEYNKQLGLYLQILNDINKEEGTNLKFGDELPRMYTRAEINSIKNYSDRIFGSFDHETKVQAERTFMGMMFGQFKTYLTATKAVWLTKPGLYNMGKRVQAKDDQTGKLLWLKEDLNSDGELVYIPTTEETGVPVYVNIDSFYEGIIYSLKDLYETYKDGGFSAIKTSIISDPLMRANLTHAGMCLFVFALVTGISKYLIELLKDEWNEKTLGDQPNFSNAAIESVGSFFEKAYLGSVGDLDLFGTVYTSVIDNTEPAAISVITKFVESTNKLVFGELGFSSYLKMNIGSIRALSSFIDNFGEVIDYTNGVIK